MDDYYFCRDGAEVEGPVTSAEIRQMLDAGSLPSSAQICAAGSKQWKPATYLKPPPPPPPARQTVAAVKQTSVPKVFGPGDPSWQPFVHFLTGSVKAIHPTAPSVAGLWLSPARKVNTAKEVAYQQRKFLDFSKAFMDSQPYVTLLTCAKHRHVEDCYELSAARFPEVIDKRFWDELTIDVQQTQAAAEKLLDNETIHEVKELCDYQNLADKISKAPATLNDLRNLRSRLDEPIDAGKAQKMWLTSVAAFAVSCIAGVFGIAKITELQGYEAVQGMFLVIAVVIGIPAFMRMIRSLRSAATKGEQTGLRGGYLDVFETEIAPCLQLAHVDPTTCTDNLDYVEQMINFVSERYGYLRERFLQPFL